MRPHINPHDLHKHINIRGVFCNHKEDALKSGVNKSDVINAYEWCIKTVYDVHVKNEYKKALGGSLYNLIMGNAEAERAHDRVIDKILSFGIMDAFDERRYTHHLMKRKLHRDQKEYALYGFGGYKNWYKKNVKIQ